MGGALQLYFRQNRCVHDALNEYMDVNAGRKDGGEAGIRHKSVHSKFLALCKAQDPDGTAWPFTAVRMGAGAIRGYVERYLTWNYDRIVATQWGRKAATKAKAGTGVHSRLVTCMPFDIVELDEHVASFIGSVRINTDEGPRYLDAGRLTIILLAERFKEMILGVKIVFREAANAGDVLDVLHAGVTSQVGYAHAEGDKTHSVLVGLDPRLGWVGFNCILLDNALIHLAGDVVSRVGALSGAFINFGPVASPARRQLVERIFNALGSMGFKRLPMTTGAGPQDPARQDAEGEARDAMIDEKEIVQLVLDLVNKFNTHKGKANLGESPYGRMASLVAGAEKDRFLFPFLPPLQTGEVDLSKLVLRVPVRGCKATGRRPYFTYLEADYTSPELAHDWGMLGKPITLHVTRLNLQTIHAVYGGEDYGECLPFGRWGRSPPHSSDTRRYVNQQIRAGYLECDYDEEPVAKLNKLIATRKQGAKAQRKQERQAARRMADQHASSASGPDATDGMKQERARQEVADLMRRTTDVNPEMVYDEWDDIGASNGNDLDY